MRIYISPEQVDLQSPEDFTSFSAATRLAAPELFEILPNGFTLDADHEHIWIDPDQIRKLAGTVSSNDDWEHQFSKMRAYAEHNGWTDSDGLIRAHIETELINHD